MAELSSEEAAALDLARELRDRVQRERLAARRLRDYLTQPHAVQRAEAADAR